ncbi:MAG TPA: phosphoribosylformylglycinamidine synthase subunit PurS [Ktedonobacterales bacterium]
MRFLARVHVTLKPSVLDPQGATVVRALGSLGFDEVSDVRVGKYLELRLTAESAAAAHERVTTMCNHLLANPVIETYDVTLAEDTSAAASSSALPADAEQRHTTAVGSE